MFSRKFVVSGLILLCIIVCGSFFWYQQHQKVTRESKTPTKQLTPQTQEDSTVQPESKNTPEHVVPADIPPLSDDAPNITSESEAMDVGAAQDASPLGAVSEAENDQEGRVSPLGLGPYPTEVPQELLRTVHCETVDNLWDRIAREAADDPEWALAEELAIRVRIKLWKQGVITRGSYRAKGHIVYPQIENVAYVEWAWKDGPDGKPQRYAADVYGPDIDEVRSYFDRGEVPPGWTVKSFEKDGIDAYEFLNLKRR